MWHPYTLDASGFLNAATSCPDPFLKRNQSPSTRPRNCVPGSWENGVTTMSRVRYEFHTSVT